ncbi:MAG TPA: hypothetical protein VHT97_06510 [Acidimicrobiales bacterium]|jgi:hypothetical protein|nr:hypothetical protein [Acidimicrobiales bacterium]
MDPSTAFARLRDANPVSPTQLAPATSPDAAALFRRIVAAADVDLGRDLDVVVGRTRRPRRRLRLLVPGVVVAGLVGAGAYAAVTRDVSKPQFVACYERADLGARTQVVSVRSGGPVEACAGLWAAGAFGAVPVPGLAACTLDSGAAGVFPTTTGADVCDRLGLARPPAPGSSTTTAPSTGAVPSGPPAAPATTAADENARFLAFRDAVLPQFLDAACVDPSTAQSVVRRELDGAGLADWAVRVGDGVGDGFSADRPCATLAFRPDERAVLLVPAPPRR